MDDILQSNLIFLKSVDVEPKYIFLSFESYFIRAVFDCSAARVVTCVCEIVFL